MIDSDNCTEEVPLSKVEIRKGTDKLNSEKAPGVDVLTKEHLKYGSDLVIYIVY